MRSYSAVSLPEHSFDPPPPSGLDRLLELQEIDVAIDRLTARIEELEAGGQLTAARTLLGYAEQGLGELRLALDQASTEQRRMENDVDSMQRKIDAERGRLYDGSVANAKELQSIQSEVAALQARKERMEDGLLEKMEEREGIEARVPAAEAEVARAKERVARIEETSGRDLVEAEASLADRTAARESVAAAIDPELLELYEDLRRQKKGVGAAALVDGVCQGCHQKLSAMELARLKRTKGVKRCEYCRRILVG